MRTILCVLALCWASVANADFPDAVQATCRITNPAGEVGTGVAVEVTGDYVGVLTNAHVVKDHSTVKCQFYRAGYQSEPIEAAVVSRANSAAVDAALLAIRTDVFGGTPPKPIPIASSSYIVKPGEEITSIGCANGSWPTAWVGHAEGYNQQSNLLFTPAPADGRSGSAVFNAAGEIVGLVFSRDTQAGLGMACSLQAMRAELAANAPRKFAYSGQISLVSWQPTQQCGPAGCGPNGCTPPANGAFLPWKKGRPQQGQQQQGQPTQPQATPWPGFGEKSPSPAIVDLSPVMEQLAVIAKNTAPKPEPPVPAPEPAKPAGPDPETVQAMQQIGQAVQRNATDIKQVGEKVETIERAVAPALKFQEFKDEVKAKLEVKQAPADNPLETKIAHVLWTLLVAGAVFAVVSLLVLMNKGVGLVGKFTADRAAKHPENAKYREAAERWADFDADVLDFARKSPALSKLVKAPAKEVEPAPAPPASPAVPATPAAA